MTEAKPPAKKSAAKRTPAAKKTAAKRTTPVKKSAAKTTGRRRNPQPKDDPLRSQVLELRRAGVAMDVIAKQLGYPSVQAAHDALVAALDATLQPTPDEEKRLLLDRLDRLQTSLWTKAMRGDLGAFAALERIMSDRHRIVSTDPLPPNDQRGPIETATADECARLKPVAPALAAAALVLARIVDENKTDAGAAATAARELRITMSQLRGLAGLAHPGAQPGTQPPAGDDPGPAKKKSNVTWLDELREKAEKKRDAGAS